VHYAPSLTVGFLQEYSEQPMNVKRVLIFITTLALVSLSAARLSAQPAQLTPQQQELANYIKKNYTKSEVLIPMRDGVKLFVCIYEPKDRKQKYPIMFDRTPYSVGPYGPDNYKTSLGPDELFAREGYIFVYGDVRGRYLSEGQYEDVRPYIPNKKGNQIDETDRHVRHGRLADQERAEQ
jgi:hypothetical protein